MTRSLRTRLLVFVWDEFLEPACDAAGLGSPDAKEIATECLRRARESIAENWAQLAREITPELGEPAPNRENLLSRFDTLTATLPSHIGAVSRGMRIATEAVMTFHPLGGALEDVPAPPNYLPLGLDLADYLPLGFLSGTWGLDPEEIAPLVLKTGLTKAAQDVARGIVREVGKRLDSWPGKPDDSSIRTLVQWEVEDAREINPDYVPHPIRGGIAVQVTLRRFINELVTELVAQEAAQAALATREVRIPSDRALIPLFTLGAPNPRDAFSIMKSEEDGELKSVRISLRQIQDDGDQLSLGYNEPEFFLLPEISQNLETGRWREEALSVLPRMLGPEALAVYFWTWADTDDAGNIFFEPGEVVRALGLSRKESRTRGRMVKIADTLTRIELRLVRKFGPSMGDEAGEYTGRLIQPSTEHFKMTPSRDGSRGPRKILIYRHALPMVNIRRKFNVGIPRDAFQLVGLWEPGAGNKKRGYQALALLNHCYILARTFATREGTKGDISYLGPEGFEMPLEDVVTAAGFVTPGEFNEHPAFNTVLARDAVKRLVKEFGFFGKGSEVFAGPDGKPRFRFVARDDLRNRLEAFSGAQLAKIEAAQAQAQARSKGRRKA